MPDGVAHLGADLLDVESDHAGQLARERLHLRPVANARHQAGRLAHRVDTSVRSVEVVALQHVAEHETVQRHPPGNELADPGIALAQPELTRVEPVRLDRDVGLRDEVGVPVEGLERRPPAGLVAVKGEDDLAAELVVVEEQPRSTRAWSSPNDVPQVATAVGTPLT